MADRLQLEDGSGFLLLEDGSYLLLETAAPPAVVSQAAVFDPEVYGEPVYDQVLIAPEVYGESPLATGSDASLSGSSTGRSSATSVLSATVALHSASAGSSSATGAISRSVALSATSNGAATATAVLTQYVPLSASSSGSSSATSALTVQVLVLLSASASGSSTDTGSVSLSVALVTSSSGASSVSGSLDVSRFVYLTSASDGRSIVSGLIDVVGFVLLRGSSAGSSSVTSGLTGGLVAAPVDIIGSYVTGTTTTTGTAAAGTLIVPVASTTGFTVGDIVVINGHEYDVAAVGSGTITLGSPLLTNVASGTLISNVVTTSLNTSTYAVSQDTLVDLEAMAPYQPVLVAMQNRHPVYVRSQVMERQINLTVFFLRDTYQQRRQDYNDFVSSLDSLSGVATLRWYVNGETKEYDVTVLAVSPDAWFYRATAVLISANPFATKVA